MTKFQKLFLLFLILSLSLGWFYWFQYRPYQVRKKCAKLSIEDYSERLKSYDSDPDLTGDELNDDKLPRSRVKRLEEQRDDFYKLCLHKFGL